MYKAAAIGTFDGLHRGHRSVLKVLTDFAAEHGMEPMAITFSNHPLTLIDPTRAPGELTPVWKKKKLLVEVGAKPVVLEFDEPLRSTTARQWMKILHDAYDVRVLVIGYDNTFGCDGINLSIEDYKRLGKEEGIEVLTAPEIKGVSSSSIRRAVAEGQMEKARDMLGRPYSITAKVVRGNSLGHTIGFPTANIELSENMSIPKKGVYAAVVKMLDTGKKFPAMVNVGTRPTVMRGNHLVLEAHIIGWDGLLYDKEITVRFIKRLRDEIKFDSIDALKQQLKEDKDEALKYALC